MQRYKIQAEYSSIKNGEMQTKNELFFISSDEDITFNILKELQKTNIKIVILFQLLYPKLKIIR